jgi:hypothetical protein
VSFLQRGVQVERELIRAHYDVRLIDLIQTEHTGSQAEIDPAARNNDAGF